MYELERRAIFSRRWQLVTHTARLRNPGDWVRTSVAGFGFMITRDRKGNIHAFHNVCRHRAYPVVSGDSGNSKILACKYHGWSYGLNGQLAKAPGYQDLEGFSKDNNGLLPIHVHVDVNGFVWVNLDSKEKPEVSWEGEITLGLELADDRLLTIILEDFDGIDKQPRYSQFNFDDYEFDHFWELEGNYNWKILADNYNECYHCATTHPDLPAVADLNSYSVQTKAAQIIHDAATTEEQRKAGLTIAATYHWPNASNNIT